MKKLTGILMVIIALLVFTKPAKAQVDIDVQANVTPNISATEMQGLDFGDIIGGSVYTINASDMSSAEVYIEGDQGATIVVDVPQSAILYNNNATDQMTFTTESLLYNNANGNSPQDRQGATLFNSGETFILSNNDGDASVYIGGSLDATNDPTAGAYNGQLTVSISYN